MKAFVSMLMFVMVLGGILTSLLTGVDRFTAPRIAENQKRKLCAGILEAFEIEYAEDNVIEVFEAQVQTNRLGESDTLYKASSGNLAFMVEGMGLQGPIEGVVALQPDLKTIAGLAITKQEETPGLGGRIGEKVFRDTFIGKVVIPDLRIVKPGSASGNNVVDGITGATLSCDALQKLLNEEIAAKLAMIQKGGAQ